MARWSRSPWRTARWCGRRDGSFSDSECAERSGRGELGGDTSGLGDKPEGPTDLPGPPGDTELLGSLLATAEIACHPVGGALPGIGQEDSL